MKSVLGIECTGCRMCWVKSVLRVEECVGYRVCWVLGEECAGCRVCWLRSVLSVECARCRV